MAKPHDIGRYRQRLRGLNRPDSRKKRRVHRPCPFSLPRHLRGCTKRNATPWWAGVRGWRQAPLRSMLGEDCLLAPRSPTSRPERAEPDAEYLARRAQGRVAKPGDYERPGAGRPTSSGRSTSTAPSSGSLGVLSCGRPSNDSAPDPRPEAWKRGRCRVVLATLTAGMAQWTEPAP